MFTVSHRGYTSEFKISNSRLEVPIIETSQTLKMIESDLYVSEDSSDEDESSDSVEIITDSMQSSRLDPKGANVASQRGVGLSGDMSQNARPFRFRKIPITSLTFQRRLRSLLSFVSLFLCLLQAYMYHEFPPCANLKVDTSQNLQFPSPRLRKWPQYLGMRTASITIPCSLRREGPATGLTMSTWRRLGRHRCFPPKCWRKP